jgi:hypothetical protein
VGNQDIRVSGDAYFKIMDQMKQDCAAAGGPEKFEKALKRGQGLAEGK